MLFVSTYNTNPIIYNVRFFWLVPVVTRDIEKPGIGSIDCGTSTWDPVDPVEQLCSNKL